MTDKETPSPSEVVKEMVADEWEEEYERPRGILTDADRQFLWGLREYSHENTAISRRQAIRERVINGIFDLSYLAMITDRDQDRIFDEFEMDAGTETLHNAITTLVGFLYVGHGKHTEPITEYVEHGIYNAEYDSGKAPNTSTVKEVRAAIDIEFEYDADAIYEKYQERESRLTSAEIGILVREGKLEAEDLEELHETEDGLGILYSHPDDVPVDDTEGLENTDGE
jgi:hypothetical protein